MEYSYKKNKKSDRYRTRDALKNYEYRNSRRRKVGRGAATFAIVFLTVLASVFVVFLVVKNISVQLIKNEDKTFTDAQMKNDIYIDYSLIGMEKPLSIRGMTRQDVYDRVLGSYNFDITILNSNPEIDLFDMPNIEEEEVNEFENYMQNDDIDSKGTSQEVQIENPYKDITIRPSKDSYKFPDFLENQLKEQIDFIYDTYLHDSRTSFKKKNANVDSKDFVSDFVFEVNEDDPNIKYYLEQLAFLWNTKAVKGQIEDFDKTKNEFIFGDDHKGYELDIEELRKRIIQEIKNKNLTANIYTILRITDPQGESIKNRYRYVSSFETMTTDNDIRNKNIELAAEAINGLILKPNQEFSFNKVVGERTEEKGYGLAAAYNQGEVVEELGGGVCQVSTTLYNAVFAAGLTTTYRRSHTFEPNYVTPGLDATVSYNGVDYRFLNDSEYAIGIRANYKKRKIKVEIFSVPILKQGYEQHLVSKQINEFDVPSISIIEEGVPQKGTKGSEWQVFKVVKSNNTEVERVTDHYSKYEGHTPTAFAENTYVDKNGVLQTRSFKTTGTTRRNSNNSTSRTNSSNQENRTTSRTQTRATSRRAETTTTQDGLPLPLPISPNANVISPAETSSLPW